MEKIPRFHPAVSEGLTDQQVEERVHMGLTNVAPERAVKTNFQIFKECVLTPFNFLCVVIAIALFAVGATRNVIFLIVVFFNVVTRIQQELTSRKLITSLQLVTSPKVDVVRNGKQESIDLTSLVLDDIILLETGQQIGADCKVLSGEVEANESVLTGESEPVLKKMGNDLLSGSFIVSGRCTAQVENVGKDNYANKIAEKAHSIKGKRSELEWTVDTLTSPFCLLVVPVALGLFWQAYRGSRPLLAGAVTSASTAALGILPIGTVLLIGLTLTAGFIRLSMKRVLLQNPYALESLAHVDTLCLDKTGTLTEGKMHVASLYLFDTTELPFSFDEFMGAYTKASTDNNATYQALAEHFTTASTLVPKEVFPFSSARKWSGVSFENVGTLVVGAPDWIDPNVPLPQEVLDHQQENCRTIMVGFTTNPVSKEQVPTCTPVALISLEDPIRPGAAETLRLLEESGIDVKIISGDHPGTVQSVAEKTGLSNPDKIMDFSHLSDDAGIENAENYTSFARVSPYQKYEIIKSLQADGHVVAMMGDGVNDVLALREADCSTTVASGTDAARKISQVVLLKSDFSVLPDLLNEGRRTMNNITCAASIFLIKTFYSLFLSIVCLFTFTAFPFNEVQITFLDWIIEGFPSFIMTLEPDFSKSKKSFLKTSILNALPKALMVVFGLVITKIIGAYYHLPAPAIFTISYIITATAGYLTYLKVSHPFNWRRISMAVLVPIFFTAVLFLFRTTLGVVLLKGTALWVGLIILGLCLIANQFFTLLVNRLSKRIPWPQF